MALSQHGDLQIDEDLDFQRREWRVQRTGWVVVLLLLLATLLGLFASGPVSDVRVRDATGTLEVEYERFARFETPSTLRLALGPRAIREGTARVSVSRSFMERVQLEDVTPEPDRVEAGPGELTYVFAAIGPAAVTFRYTPQAPGVYRASLATGGLAEVDISQFVYP